MVEDYKYLGVLINNRLNRKTNTEAVYKKNFYQSAVASVLYFIACWGSSTEAGNSIRLNIR